MTVAGQGSPLGKDSTEVKDTLTTQGRADTGQGAGRGPSRIRDTPLLCWNVGGTARHLGDPD